MLCSRIVACLALYDDLALYFCFGKPCYLYRSYEACATWATRLSHLLQCRYAKVRLQFSTYMYPWLTTPIGSKSLHHECEWRPFCGIPDRLATVGRPHSVEHRTGTVLDARAKAVVLGISHHWEHTCLTGNGYTMAPSPVWDQRHHESHQIVLYFFPLCPLSCHFANEHPSSSGRSLESLGFLTEFPTKSGKHLVACLASPTPAAQHYGMAWQGRLTCECKFACRRHRRRHH